MPWGGTAIGDGEVPRDGGLFVSVEMSRSKWVIAAHSALVDRPAKRAKTDRIGARAMVRALMVWARGECQVLSGARVSAAEQEDARRGQRARQRLVKERTAQGNRIKGVLKTQGIMDFDPRAPDAVARLGRLVTGDSRPLGPCLKREILRELERLALVIRQIAQVEADRDAIARVSAPQAGNDVAGPERAPAMIALLTRLRGIGLNDATVLAREAFWRDFRNRREAGGWSGLAPSPWTSGSVSCGQGITRAGPPVLRAQMIQMSWRWLFWQPDSELTHWYRNRTEGAACRMRRIMVAALARKLLAALWRYAASGLVPRGAIMT